MTRAGAHLIRSCLFASLLALALGGGPVRAGVLDAERLRALFPAPYVVGEKDSAIPVWPVFKQNGPSTDLVCYESVRRAVASRHPASARSDRADRDCGDGRALSGHFG
jgi:hypothetical protein